ERDQLELRDRQGRGEAPHKEARRDFVGRGHRLELCHAVCAIFGCPSDRNTSRTIFAPSFTSPRDFSIPTFSLPASLMCLFFCTRSMMRIGSIGGFGLKVTWMTPGAASTFTTP